MSDVKKPYKVKLEVTYTVYVPVDAWDEDGAVDEVEKIVKMSDDYELVNRSSEKKFTITEIKDNYPKPDKSTRRTKMKKKN